MQLFNTTTLLLILVAAAGYSFATVGMKLGSATLSPAAIAIMATGFVMAAGAEVIILKNAHLGVIYIAIIGIETLAVLCYATAIGEGLGPKQLFGAGLVLGGMLLVGH
ncbi:5-aminolevulinate synthase [Neotabrizicola sp. VNH66]|uniref:5-aminolevulinate synthase n=1 Tax=Neotabrizicola sp. VNH66 TaxID=3400918 RepID=UPI003BFAEDF4